jgi:hypothetical protein
MFFWLIFLLFNKSAYMLDLIHFKPFSYYLAFFHTRDILLSFSNFWFFLPKNGSHSHKKNFYIATRKKAVTNGLFIIFLHLWNSFMISDYHNICIMGMIIGNRYGCVYVEAIFKELFFCMRLFFSFVDMKSGLIKCIFINYLILQNIFSSDEK